MLGSVSLIYAQWSTTLASNVDKEHIFKHYDRMMVDTFRNEINHHILKPMHYK